MATKKKKAKAKKKTPNLQHWLINKLRRISYQWGPRKEAIKRGRVSRGKYKCDTCGGENFGPKEIQLDHIIPVIDPHQGFQDWNTFIDRLFCETENFSIKCKPCHTAKSHYENEIRRQVKKDNNNDSGEDI